MKVKNVYEEMRRLFRLMVYILLPLAGGGWVGVSCTERDELAESEPSWLGNSIYERLQDEGSYRYTLRLIDDLKQTDVLSQTGSKTVFVADDKVYDEFFHAKRWGADSYDKLSDAQKKLLFNSAMVNNAYLVELLSNVSGPTPLKGQCMRRETAASVFDSVARIYPEQMPNTHYWDKYRNRKEGIVLLRDNTTKPMIHFLPDFMRYNNITDADLEKLTNGSSKSIADAWVNGKKLVERDITCKNGYIQKVDGLATAADNMMEILHTHPVMSRFASLLDRFSAPYYDAGATKEYNRLYNNQDSVFVLKYFSQNSNVQDYPGSEGGTLTSDPDGNVVPASLAFDPGWNQYIYSNTAGKDLHYDAGALLAPSNDALDFWWNNGGKALKDMYKTWENVPMKVLVKMLDINLVRSFTESVPSKFKNIVDNTTKVPIDIKPADVDSCFMGCNGVVYLLNKVFTPASYSSVSFPALVNENTMNVIYWAIDNLGFEPYLNSMDSYYSLIIPTNNAMLTYIDPCSYGESVATLWEFYYDTERETVNAHRYNYDMKTGQKLDGDLTDAMGPDPKSGVKIESQDTQVQNRLTDLLDNLIIVGDIESGHTYYHTKGGSIVRVTDAGQQGVMTIAGGYQTEQGCTITVDSIYDMTKNGNGKSYVIDSQLPLTSHQSLYSILKDRADCDRFFGLLTKGGSTNTLLKNTMGGGTYTCADYNCSLFDAYHYTVYVPTDAQLDQLHADGLLPYWSDYEALDTITALQKDNTLKKKVKSLVANRIMNFAKYHIQDNSVFIGGDSIISQTLYETSTLNPRTKRFYSVTVDADDSQLTIEDQLGNKRSVVKGANCNLIGREYWIKDAAKPNSVKIYNASNIVVHQIDGPLFYETAQKATKWQDEVEETIKGKSEE